PGIPRSRLARNATSASGRSAINASAIERIAFSPATSAAMKGRRFGAWLITIAGRLLRVLLAVVGQDYAHLIEHVSGHHRAAHLRVRGLGKAAPRGFQIRAHRMHLEPALLHRFDALAVFLSRTAAHFDAGRVAGSTQLITPGGGHLVPRFLGYHSGAGHRN